jgi:hypothetical protein
MELAHDNGHLKDKNYPKGVRDGRGKQEGKAV